MLPQTGGALVHTGLGGLEVAESALRHTKPQLEVLRLTFEKPAGKPGVEECRGDGWHLDVPST